MTVRGILKRKGREVIVVHRRTLVSDAIAKMRRRSVGALVISQDGREIQGIVTERDMVHALAAQGVDKLLSMTVAGVRSRPVEVCRPNDSVKRIMGIMTRRRVRHMPVVDDNGLCGIVSIGDVVKQRLAETELEVDVIRETLMISQ